MYSFIRILIMKKLKINEGFLKAFTIILLLVIATLGITLYKKQEEITRTSENSFNMAFYELVDYVQNVEAYLAKSLVSTTSERGAETLTHLWREANLAQSCLSMLPVESQELENTEKFLNQVSEYSYTMANKCIDGQDLSDEDMDKIQELYNYANDLSNTLNEMITELNNGIIKWEDLKKNAEGSDISEVSNFNMVEQNFHEYSGLIYDGAFSEHITSEEKKGLIGNDISEDEAKIIAEEFIGKDKIKETKNNGYVENGNIPVYRFEVTTNENKKIGISISKKGGHLVYMNYDRETNGENITEQDAIQKGKEYLQAKKYENMQETYYMKNDGYIVINYAYKQGNIVAYPDLIKLKIALDNGEIVGVDATGYLNCHFEREIPSNLISIDEARKNISTKAELSSEKLAIIPTEFNTEVLCYEFKGKINEVEFIEYINAQTGKEEDILIVTNTENGTLTE